MGLKSTLSSFEITAAKTPEVQNLIGSVAGVLRPVLQKEILDGILLAAVPLLSGSVNHISHKMGRAAIGYIVVKQDANSSIWDSESLNLRKNLFLDLNCSVTCIVSLWVF